MNKWMVFISLLCVAGLSAPFMREHDAQFYYDRGSETLAGADPDHEWFFRWNLSSARADFSHAIRLNPQFTAAYSSRAAIESMKGDSNGALKDYNSIIGLDPQDPNNYLARAEIETSNRDFDQALKDYNKVIELQPDNRAAYRGRMNVRESQNDPAGAVMERVRMIEETIPALNGPLSTNGGLFTGRNPGRWHGRFLAQLDHALEANTNFAWGYYYRGVTKSLANDWDGALADFQRCQNFPDGRLRDYAAIHSWLVQMRTGEKEKAGQELLAYCQNRTNGTTGDWQMHIGQFLLNQISETELSGAIESSDTGREQSEFWYYTGMKRLLDGDKAGAGDCFRKSLATRTRPYAVFLSAVTELRSLDLVAADQ